MEVKLFHIEVIVIEPADFEKGFTVTGVKLGGVWCLKF
jgi:hypothetical protein